MSCHPQFGSRGLARKRRPAPRTHQPSNRGRPGGGSRAARGPSPSPVGKIIPGAFPWFMDVRHSSFLTAQIHLSEMHRRGPRGGEPFTSLHVQCPQNDGAPSGFWVLLLLILAWCRLSNFLRWGLHPVFRLTH